MSSIDISSHLCYNIICGFRDKRPKGEKFFIFSSFCLLKSMVQ